MAPYVIMQHENTPFYKLWTANNSHIVGVISLCTANNSHIIGVTSHVSKFVTFKKDFLLNILNVSFFLGKIFKQTC